MKSPGKVTIAGISALAIAAVLAGCSAGASSGKTELRVGTFPAGADPAALGFCMGGGFALMTADSGFEAASVNYGMLPTDLLGAVENACPIVASYGGSDRTLRGAAAKLETALTAAGVVHDVKEYPKAGHAFLNEEMSGPVVMRPLMRVMGIGPHPESAPDAWASIDGFFGEHLR